MRKIKSYYQVEKGDWILGIRKDKDDEKTYPKLIRVISGIDKIAGSISWNSFHLVTKEKLVIEKDSISNRNSWLDEWDYFILNEKEKEEYKNKIALESL